MALCRSCSSTRRKWMRASISGSKNRAVPRPSVFAKYSAMSASLINVSYRSAITRRYGDPMLTPDHDLMTIDIEWLTKSRNDPAGKNLSVVGLPNGELNNGKFIPAQTRDCVYCRARKPLIGRPRPPAVRRRQDDPLCR